MSRVFTLCFATAFTLLACSSWKVGPFPPEPSPPCSEPGPNVSEDSAFAHTLPPVGCDDCASACWNRTGKLKACAWTPLPADDSCVDKCEHAVTPVDYTCITWAKDCTALAECMMPPDPPQPDPAPPEPDPGPIDLVRQACSHLRELRCPSGEPTAAGASCEVVMGNRVEQGTLPVPLGCLIASRDCFEAEGC